MFSKLVQIRLKNKLKGSDQEELDKVIANCSYCNPEEEVNLFLTFFNGLKEKNEIVPLMGVMLESFLVLTNPSPEYCKKTSDFLGALIIDDNSAYSNKLKEMQQHLFERIKLTDTDLPNYKSKLLKTKVTLKTCVEIALSLNEVKVPINKEYVAIMVEKLKSISPKNNANLRKNYIILINELKKSNYEEFSKSLKSLADDTILKQIGSHAIEVENNMMNIQLIGKRLKKLELPHDIEKNISVLEKYGENVDVLKKELNKYKEELSADKKKGKLIYIHFYESTEKVYSGEDLEHFDGLGQFLIDKSREALTESKSTYQDIKRKISDYSNKVAALSKNAQEQSNKINKEYKKIVKEYQDFFSEQEEALTQLQFLKLQKQTGFQFLLSKKQFCIDSLQSVFKIFDEVDDIDRSFQEAFQKFQEEKNSIDKLQNPSEKMQKLQSFSDNYSRLSTQLKIKDRVTDLENLLEGVRKELNKEATELRNYEKFLTQKAKEVNGTIAQSRGNLEIFDEQIKKLKVTHNLIKESFRSQYVEISILTGNFSEKLEDNNRNIDKKNKEIKSRNYFFTRFFFRKELKKLREEKSELEKSNARIFELIPILLSLDQAGREIYHSKTEMDLKKNITSYETGFEKFGEFFQKHNINLSDFFRVYPALIPKDTSEYLKNTTELKARTSEKDTLSKQIETDTKEQDTLMEQITEAQEKIEVIEQHKTKNLKDILKEQHGIKGVRDLTKEENIEFVRLLHGSAQAGNIEQIKLLLDHCINFNIPNHNGNNALHLAAYKAQVDAVKLFLTQMHEEWYFANKDGNTPLHFAISSRNIEVVVLLLEDLKSKNVEWNSPNKIGNTPLHSAVLSGNSVVVRLLLEDLKSKKSDLWNIPNKYNYTPLFLAYKKYTEAPQDTDQKENYKSIIQNLRNYGAEFNEDDQDRLGNSIIHMAAKNGDIQLIQASIQKDKSMVTQLAQLIDNPIDKKNTEGKTPLQLALENNHKNVVCLLLNAGVIIEKHIFSTEQGKKFLSELSTTGTEEDKKLLELFVKKGLITSLPKPAIEKPSINEHSIVDKKTTEEFEEFQETQELPIKGKKQRVVTDEVIDASIKEMSSLNFTDQPAREEWIEKIKASSYKQKPRLVNAKDKDGNTLFHVLVQQKDQETINELIQHADVYIQNNKKQLVLDLARIYMKEKSTSFMGTVESIMGTSIAESKEGKIFLKIAEQANAQNRSQLTMIQIINKQNEAFKELLKNYKSLNTQLIEKNIDVSKYKNFSTQAEKIVETLVKQMNDTQIVKRNGNQKECQIRVPLEKHVIWENQKQIEEIIELLKVDINEMEKSLKELRRFEWHINSQDGLIHQKIKSGILNEMNWEHPRLADILARDINKPSGGYTPLQLAIAFATTDDSVEDQEKSLQMAKFLIEKGAEINIQNSQGETVLHLLAKRKDKAGLEIMKLLQQHQVNTEIENKDGKIARQIARENNNKNFLDLYPHKVFGQSISFFPAEKKPESANNVEQQNMEQEELLVDDYTSAFRKFRSEKGREELTPSMNNTKI